MFAETYDTLLDLIREFPDDEACRKHLEHIRWGEAPICPHCGGCQRIYALKGRKRYKCGDCKKKFSVLVKVDPNVKTTIGLS